MILRAYFATLGRLALLLATMAFLTAAGLLVLGGFLSTYPILRVSPRDRRLKLVADGVATIIPALVDQLRSRSPQNVDSEATSG